MTVFQEAPRSKTRIKVKRAHRAFLSFIRRKIQAKAYRLIAKILSPFSSATSDRYTKRSKKYEAVELIYFYDKIIGDVPYYSEKPSILIVCQNAAQGEDTSLALNITRLLSKNFNITSLFLRGGELQSSFLASSETVLSINSHSSAALTYTHLLAEICEAREYSYAVIVSLESHVVLRGLKKSCVASVMLVGRVESVSQHEEMLPEAIGRADEFVFLTSPPMKKAISSNFNKIDFAQRIELCGEGRLAIKNRCDSRTDTAGAVTHRLGRQGHDDPEPLEICFAIESMGQAADKRIRSRTSDIQTIRNSGCFRSDFFLPSRARRLTEDEAIARYIDRQKSAASVRKPEPGFNPFIYSDENADTYYRTRDAYADFLSKGRPEGPWILPVLEGSANACRHRHSTNLRVALHIHSFYIDVISDLISRLNLNQTMPDIYVSVRNQSDRESVHQKFKFYRGDVRALEIVPNRGRDIGPFLTLFRAELQADYDVIGHVHLKKSSHLNKQTTADWQNFLLENLVGGPVGGPMMDAITQEFANDPQVGIAFASDPHAVGWLRNLEAAQELARRMGHFKLPRSINFPVGTMFWIRASALESFTKLDLSWDDYPPEPIGTDGTMLHALERLFGVIPQLEGWRTIVTNIPGISR